MFNVTILIVYYHIQSSATIIHLFFYRYIGDPIHMYIYIYPLVISIKGEI
jgi:hypothetical protein